MRALFFSLLILVGCKAGYDPVPQPPMITDTHECKPACEHLRELKCPDGCGPGFESECSYPDGGTYSCEDYCVNTQSNGVIHVWLNPSCVKEIPSCDKIESCAVVKKGK